MTTTITEVQAITLLRDVLSRASHLIAIDLPIFTEIDKALRDTAGLDPFDAGDHPITSTIDDQTLEATAGPQQNTTMQEQFETHMLARDKNVMLEKKEDGSYASWFTTRYWITWLAASEVAARGSIDAHRLDWLDENIFHREMDSRDKRRAEGCRMFVLFAPNDAQGTARKIIDAARTREAGEWKIVSART